MVLADQKWKSAVPPHKQLHIEALTEWFAGKVGLPYFHVDPLKINFSSVTEIMSSAYAERFKILPVDVTSKEAVIATAEPYLREWEQELSRILKLEIKRVFANPLDINRYIVEFYNLAKSVKRAAKSGRAAPSSRISSSSSSSGRPIASSTRTTSTSSTSSIGCGSTPSTSARATSTSSRAATWATCDSGSTAFCTASIRFRCPSWRP